LVERCLFEATSGMTMGELQQRSCADCWTGDSLSGKETGCS
jgi:hypothetical protein